jgi:hypothetical protein
VSDRIGAAVLAYVRRHDWPHQLDPAGIVSFPGAGRNGAWQVHALADEEREQLLVHSVLEEVPEDRRVPMAVFLTMANFGLVLGNFELDLRDGELRYKTSADVEDVEVTDPLVDHLVMANVATVDRYLPGIRAVLAGEEPAAAIDAVEARARP